MGQDLSVKDALTSVYELAAKLQEQGFIILGTVTITKAKIPMPGEAQLYVNPDGRFGILKIAPGKPPAPAQTQLLPPQPSPDAFYVPEPSPGSMAAVSKAIATVSLRDGIGYTGNKDAVTGTSQVSFTRTVKAEPAGDGIIRDGSVCTNCGGTSFTRKGSCLYCQNCGESVGGCS